MINVLDEIELLYRRLGWTTATTRGRLSVSNRVAGFDEARTFARLDSDDPDKVLDLAAELEGRQARREDTVVICDVDVGADAQGLLRHVALGPFTPGQWYNEVINHLAVCKKIRDLVKTEPPFVDPQLEPMSFADLRQWFQGDDVGNDTLGQIVMLLGPAGYGKTTIARRLADAAAERHQADASSPVPILISLEKFRTERQWDDLLSAYSRDERMPDITPAALQLMLSRGRAVLLVDGLDELAERGGVDAAASTLRELAENLDSGRMMFTARDAYVEQFRRALKSREKDVTFADVRGVDVASVDGLLPDRPATVRAAVRRIISGAGGAGPEDSLFRNPMLIRYLADVLEKTTDLIALEAEFAQRAAAGGTALLNRVFQELIAKANVREQERQSLGLDPWDYVDLFGAMAVEALRLGLASSHEDNLVVPEADGFMTLWVESRMRDAGLDPAAPHSATLRSRWQASLRTHPLVEVTNLDGATKVVFRHPFLRDSVAALYLASEIAQGHLTVGPLAVGGRLTQYVAGRLEQLMSDVQLQSALGTNANLHQPGMAFIMQLAMDRAVRDAGDDESLVSAQKVLGSWVGVNAIGTRLRRLDFGGCPISRADLDSATFDRCRLVNVERDGTNFSHTSFHRSSADEQFVQFLRSVGVVELPAVVRSVTVPGPDSVDEFVAEVVLAFFRRFIRGEPGRHQRSVAESSFVRGLPTDKSDFTRKELLPVAEAQMLVEYMPTARVYKFNPQYQNAGDMMIASRSYHETIRAFVHEIGERARRYFA